MTMKFSTFKYHLGQGTRSLLKNGFMSLAAIATVIACSFILILSLCVCMNIDYILRQIEENIGITVFLGPNVTDDMAEEIGEKIRSIDHVTDAVYKSAEDNLNDAMNSWENASILEGLKNDNPLPASYEISLDGAAYQDQVVKELQTLQLSVEAELNSAIDPDSVEKIYLDANGNRISEKQAKELGIAEESTESASQTESETESSVQMTTQKIISNAGADVTAAPVNEQAQSNPTAEAPTEAAADQTAEKAAQTAEKETQEKPTEAVTYSSEPSKDLLNTLDKAVAATAGGQAELSGSTYYYNEKSADGVAGINKYDASAYGMKDYEYKGIEKIRHAADEARILVRINTAVRIFSIIVVIILCVISVSIIMNTIRLTVVIRKNEINIMKYVGATDWFIRWPFIIEGMLIGLIGSVIPSVLCFFGYTECLHLLSEKIPVFSNIAQFMGPVEIFAYIAPITIIFGILLGVIGSVSSMRKYLRV